MKQIELKKYITETLGITYREAAEMCGVSPQHLEAVANGRVPAGRALCVKLAKWGKGRIDLSPLMMIEKGK